MLLADQVQKIPVRIIDRLGVPEADGVGVECGDLANVNHQGTGDRGQGTGDRGQTNWVADSRGATQPSQGKLARASPQSPPLPVSPSPSLPLFPVRPPP